MPISCLKKMHLYTCTAYPFILSLLYPQERILLALNTFLYLSAIFLNSSSSSDYGCFCMFFYSHFNIFEELLKCSQTSTDSNLKYLLGFCCKTPCLILYYAIYLKSKIPDISFGLNITVSDEIFVTSNMAEFLMYFSFSIVVLFPFYLTFYYKLNPDM